MKNLSRRFAKDQSGVTAIEYGLIAALVAVAIIGALQALSGSLSSKFNSIANVLNSAAS